NAEPEPEPEAEAVPPPALPAVSAFPLPHSGFFGFTDNPFSATPSSGVLFWTPQSKEILASLIHGVEGRRGLAVLTGEAGAGKTTVLKCLAEHLYRESVEFAFLVHSRVSVDEFYQMLEYDLALNCPQGSKAEIQTALNRLLFEQAARGKTTALIIDEAQNLGPEVLEEIQLLDNLHSRRQKLLQVVLAGQPELDRNLEAGSLRSLRQQIMRRCFLKPFTVKATFDYIAHRFACAGLPRQEIFPPPLLAEIHRRCQGIPGAINIVCDNLLRICSASGSRAATPEMLERVSEDLYLTAAGGA
ncbi:MAG: AAA family ATPase, partial [Bryobacterales bacterium]|nr:AAA family ATPase [Bryobacterales bacterium]